MLKISAFYLDKQKSFVPNAMKLCNSCNMMFIVSNYLYVVTPITVALSKRNLTQCDMVLRIAIESPNEERKSGIPV